MLFAVFLSTQDKLPALFRRNPIPCFGCRRLQKICRFRLRNRQTAKRIVHRRTIVAKHRQQLQTDTVPLDVGQRIRLILSRLQAFFQAIIHDLLFGQKEQRTNDIALTRPHSRKAVNPAAAQDMHEHGFRLIARVMACGNQRSFPHPARRFNQKRVTPFPCRRFHGKLLTLRISRNILMYDTTGKAFLLRINAHKFRVRQRRCAANPVLKMRNPKRKSPLLAKRQQHFHQREGIRTARTCNDDAAAWCENSMLPYKRLDAAFQFHPAFPFCPKPEKAPFAECFLFVFSPNASNLVLPVWNPFSDANRSTARRCPSRISTAYLQKKQARQENVRLLT